MKSETGDTLAATIKSLPVRGAWIEIPAWRPRRRKYAPSLPVRGAWIEIRLELPEVQAIPSLPVRGAWIEIYAYENFCEMYEGRSPYGERGLKLGLNPWATDFEIVAPRTGSVD